RAEQVQQVVQVMRPRHRQPEFLQQPLQILLGTLLAVEADAIRYGVLAPTGPPCEDEVFFGLAHPLGRRPFHKGPFPSTRPPSGTTPLPPGASSFPSASGR